MREGLLTALSLLLLFSPSGAALAQTAEENFTVRAQFLQGLFDPSYEAIFITQCKIHGIDDILGDEFLIYLDKISPEESFIDKDLMDIVFVSEGKAGIVVSERPDFVPRYAEDLTLFANQEWLPLLTAAELDRVDLHFMETLKYFHEICEN